MVLGNEAIMHSLGIRYPAEYITTEDGQIPPNLRCMGESAKAMREHIRHENEKINAMLHASRINASQALPPQ